MRRFVIGALVAAPIVLMVGKIAEKVAPALRVKCTDACEQMLAKMPESFRPTA